MSKIELLVLYFCTILTMFSLYAVQPIQPLFEQTLHLSTFESVLFTTAVMIPLGFAPVLYGFLLESLSAKSTLRFCILTLGILEILFAISEKYFYLLNIRAAQGFLIPALLTSLMSYISNSSSKEQVQSAISTYIGITILGGFLARLLSGIATDFFGWRIFFAILGCVMIFAFFTLRVIKKDTKSNFVKPTISKILKIIQIKHNFYIYSAIFCIFFVFQAVLNFIPFELKKILGNYSASKIGLVYAGYVVGLLIAINASKIIKFLKSENNSMLIGSLVYLFSIQLFHVRDYGFIFSSMFVFCFGMFLVHSIASGYVNKLANEYKSITNGLYLSSYYLGGALGTFAPGVIYNHFGWHYFLFSLSLVLIVGVFALFRLKYS